ncbi:MAG: DUF4012 domain-containing protein [Patescibacteria group bacterium]
MQLITETDRDKQKILIVDKSSSAILPLLKKELSKYDTDIFISPQILPNINTFQICYVIDESLAAAKKIIHLNSRTKVVFIFQHYKRTTKEVEIYIKQHFSSKKELFKCIELEDPLHVTDEDIEKILWFSFSESSDILLTIHPHSDRESDKKPLPQAPGVIPLKYAKRPRSRRKVFFLIGIALLILHLAYIPPLLLTNILFYNIKTTALKSPAEATMSYKKAQTVLAVSKMLYTFVRPTYQLLSVAYFTDGIFQLDDSISLTVQRSIALYYDANSFTSLLLKKQKTPSDIALLQSSKERLEEDLDAFDQYISIVIQKLPNWKKLDSMKNTLQDLATSSKTAQKLLQNVDSIFAKDTEKQYLIMFANNMELRPGGGFIGSFGIAKVHNYSIEPVKIYDVYDADGQLKTHIDPPDPIRLYLQQPHWFLRDSAFSPDFATNYAQAKSFLREEMNIQQLDGGILLTTTTIQNILEGMGDVYIPDFKEIVNKNNFYIKAQLYSEKDFFPGSTQKKRFLGSVADQMLVNLENASQLKVLQMVEKSLEEKQMVMYFDDPKVQETINTQYWSGQALVPKCPTGFENCINNYIFPYEANLGVNKANFFVKKFISMRSTIDEDGVISNKLQIMLNNESITNVFPGGIYKNYLQVLLPATAKINQITKNKTLVDTYDLSDGESKLLGIYLEIPAQATSQLEIEYTIETGLDKGKGAYQFVVQKQIGSANSEFQFELFYPNNIHPVSQNFSPLVKHNEILYNTTLTADKIFFIELFKE